ncbi:hypothetical protein PRZ48_004783 [Zasmidium cellare]|uniref:alpha-1,2-Mannosidase n=1 Tax=Zasmidium cellare TaxID=395010 RepID=A0ABR0ERQ3_ZASCE|nr:hypothetical protein PRZ48_004783 [Zasmidium cellare]
MFSFLSFAAILSLILHSFDAIVKAQDAPQYSSTGLLSTTQAGPVVPDHTNLPATLTLTRPNGPLPTSTGKNGSCKNVQAAGVSGDSQRAQAIKDAFVYAWDAYEKYAYGFDELEPLSANGTNSRYGWGLTIVDSIDTAIIMDLEDVVEKMLKFIATVDFTTTDEGDPVNLFETNIRYIGGLISAYDLLKSGQFPNNYDQSLVDGLLEQAVRLTNIVILGFNTPSGLPAAELNWTTRAPIPGEYTDDATNTTYNATNTASSGTFVLDWARLSDLTGNETYRRITEKANSYLVNPSPPPVYPGLVGTQFNTDTGKMLTFDGGWQAGVDSFLEYLIKDYQYSPTNTTLQYRDFWLTAVQSTLESLVSHPFGFPDLTFISYLDVNGTIRYFADDFSCFAGGNYLLGGALLDIPEITALGIAYTDGCHQTYNTTTTGLGPLAWAWFNSSGQAYNPASENDAAALKSASKRGFWIPARVENWFSRPEPIESIWYAHRITGDPRWAEYNWEIFKAINETSRNRLAFAAVNNVDMPGGGSMSDALDSFFFAEVLKYLYLTFTEPDVIDLSEWVFNTEAHPFLATCAGGQGNGTSAGGSGRSSKAML